MKKKNKKWRIQTGTKEIVYVLKSNHKTKKQSKMKQEKLTQFTL